MNNTANHLQFGQHLLGLNVRVNPWFWIPGLVG